MKIIENPEQKQFSDFVHSIPHHFEKDGSVIYKQRNEIRVFDVNGTPLNVKRFKVPGLFNRIIYTFFRPSKALRSFRYAMKLKEQGMNTPEPVACILIKRGGLLHYSYYISRQVEDCRTMYEFGKDGIAGREHILDAFARFTARLHEKRFFHRDYSPGNILFKEEKGEVNFWIVDINRMRFGPVNVAKGCSNFARLWGQKPFFLFVAGAYAKARQAAPEECTRQVLSARSRFWKKFTRKRPLPFMTDEAAADSGNTRLSVILSTYNQPDWLEKVLWGYEAQTDPRFEVVIADDGSNEQTRDRITLLQSRLSYPIRQVWHEDNGFQKCTILNKAILAASTDYLLFSDGDCIPRNDFVAVHLQRRRKGRFLSGGYYKLPMDISREITAADIVSQRCFNIKWLKKRGLKSSFKNNKLTSFGCKESLLNRLTPTKPSWNGHNASGWLSDILEANGFDERMRYGGEDRELGERLENRGIRGMQIRYSAVCVHLDHSRGYVKEEDLRKNKEIRKTTHRSKSVKTPYGIIRTDSRNTDE